MNVVSCEIATTWTVIIAFNCLPLLELANVFGQAYRHLAYRGKCVQHGGSCASRQQGQDNAIIPGATINHQLPRESRICAAGLDCCVQVFPSEVLVPRQGTTLAAPIVKEPHCAVMDTDGLRPREYL